MRRRLRLLLLRGALALSDLIWHVMHRLKPRGIPACRHSADNGLSVIIPERGSPDLLAECLESVTCASDQLSEPSEVIVVVDGGSQDDYQELAERFRTVRWLFSSRTSGISSALQKGLAAARHEWAYILNNDVILDREALRQVMRWRAPHVFGIASQIFFRDPARRRQETGWANFRIEDGCLEMFHAEPEDERTVRGGFCAGSGASLFQKRILEQVFDREEPYSPFYWEDTEWSIVAWKMGFEVLFCPASRVWHCHRATISKFYPPQEVQRIFRRNALRFQLRNLKFIVSINRLCSEIMELDDVSFRELVGAKNTWRVFKARVRSARYRFDDSCLQNACARFYLQPPAGRCKPLILVVTPVALFPPSHGAAKRMHRLMQPLLDRFHVVVLSGEAESYSKESRKYLEGFFAIHMVTGRIGQMESPPERAGPIFPALIQELKRRIGCDRPDLVQIEFIELAPLIAMAPKNAPWGITLHEMTASGIGGIPEHLSRVQMKMVDRYDALIVTCAEDRSLLRKPARTVVIQNGMDPGDCAYASSENNTAILFSGSLRNKCNLDSIQMFLERVYPRLRERVPALQLWLLGGHGALARAEALPCFWQTGVTVYEYIGDPCRFLQRCAVTIHPVLGRRGSSLNLIDALAAGRVCVSTAEGARGQLAADFPSLLTVDGIERFYDPLARLLCDPALRVTLEKPHVQGWQDHGWRGPSQELLALYLRLLSRSS